MSYYFIRSLLSYLSFYIVYLSFRCSYRIDLSLKSVLLYQYLILELLFSFH